MIRAWYSFCLDLWTIFTHGGEAVRGNLDAQTYGEAVDAAMLIPQMPEAFMARDGGQAGRRPSSLSSTFRCACRYCR